MLLTVTPPPLPRPARWAAAGVLALMVAYGAVYAVVGHSAPAARAVPAGIVAVVAVVLAALLPDRIRGGLVPVLFAVAAAGVAVACFATPSNAGWFAVCALIGWATWTASYAVAGGLWAAITVTLVVQAATSPDNGWIAWIVGSAFSLFGFAAARRQRELVLQLREAQAGLAARAQSEERARIARELHDVIAHSLTVSLMHVSAARLALAEDPSDADRALAEAERLGRSSLDEVRHAVGSLRTEADPSAPLPGSTDVPALLAGFRAAGADVRATVDGELAGLPSTIGLAAYRILQEALTNALKHAPGHPVTVHLAVTDTVVSADVDSAGEPGRGHGLGVVGMRERAAAVGGRCDAGPGGSGWRVHAELPLKPVASR